jgi:hypothetical protein
MLKRRRMLIADALRTPVMLRRQVQFGTGIGVEFNELEVLSSGMGQPGVSFSLFLVVVGLLEEVV